MSTHIVLLMSVTILLILSILGVVIFLTKSIAIMDARGDIRHLIPKTENDKVLRFWSWGAWSHQLRKDSKYTRLLFLTGLLASSSILVLGLIPSIVIFVAVSTVWDFLGAFFARKFGGVGLSNILISEPPWWANIFDNFVFFQIGNIVGAVCVLIFAYLYIDIWHL